MTSREDKKIITKAIEILKSNPDGVRYSDLVRKISREFPEISINTINTVVRKLEVSAPDEVYKPARGFLRHVKFKEEKVSEEPKGCPETDETGKELSDEEKKKIEEMYKRAIENVDKQDVEYALKATKEKFQKTKFSDSNIGWLRKLGRRIKLLYEMLRDSFKGKFDVPWYTIAAVAAALIYFVNPWDIVPDFIPVLGYVDDATVIALCIALVKEDLLRYCKKRGLDPSEYGFE